MKSEKSTKKDKKQVNITRKGSETVFKTRLSVAWFIVLGLPLVSLVVAPFFFSEMFLTFPGILLWIGLGIVNISAFVICLFTRIVIDTEKRELCVYDPLPHKVSLDKLYFIDTVHKSDSEGGDRCCVQLGLYDGRVFSVNTESPAHSEALANELRAFLSDK